MLTAAPHTAVPHALGPLGSREAKALFAHAHAAIVHDVESARAYLYQLEALLAGAASAPSVREPLPPLKPAPVRGGLQPWQVRRVAAHVEAHLGRPIPIGELATLAKLSNGYFSLAFKVSFGDSPHNFIMRKRVERAQALMIATSDTLSEIACDCGLVDQAHLTRLFRKFVGDTPLWWRRKWRQRD